MKKIPTAFKRVYENHRIIDILPEFGFAWPIKKKGHNND